MNKPIIDLTTNVSQIFTELYKTHLLLENPNLNVFEESLYLEGNQAKSIKSRMDNALQDYHKTEKTLNLYINPKIDIEDQVFIAGNGSTQIYKGLVYAMATSYPDKQFLFVQKIPYFSGHREAVNTVFNYPNATYQGYNDPSEINPDLNTVIVEFVTSPNNPDGTFRKPQFKSTPENKYIIIGDFVFTSSSFGTSGDGYIPNNLLWLNEYRSTDTTIFSYNSASKQFGHTGDRYGYMWFPMYDDFAKKIFSQLNNFLAITVGSNLRGASNFLNLLLPFSKNVDIKKEANESLKLRLMILSESINVRYPGSEVTSLPGSPTMFVKIKDKRIHLPDITASDIIFEDTNVETVRGSLYGANDEFVRINIMALSEDLALFSNRLIDEKKYTQSDLIIKSDALRPCMSALKQKIIKKIICNTSYVVDPNDRYLLIDSSEGNTTINLPEFLGYEQKMKLCIKRIDCTCSKVKIKSKNFIIKLNSHDKVLVIWEQPFYSDGFWKILYCDKIYSQNNNISNTRKDAISLLYLV